ncbi:MAG: hypothetical protein F7C81_00910 [Desulfurococcales archaeon]|nr:hypothetical protein [Desulfurococcales archaeon]
MSSLEEVCTAIREVLEASKSDRGGHVGYTPYHVIEALRLMKGRAIGRHQLLHNLGIGEASAKTLIKRLRSHNIVRTSKTGHTLTGDGAKLLEKIINLYNLIPLDQPLPGFREPVIITTPYVNPPVDIVDVYRIRDQIIIHGCEKTIIGGIINGNLTFPGIPENLLNTIKSRITDLIKTRKHETILIIEKTCIPNAVNALLYLIDKYCIG